MRTETWLLIHQPRRGTRESVFIFFALVRPRWLAPKRIRQIGSANVNPEANAANHTGADVFVSYEGSIFLFNPLIVEAQQWIDENVRADAQWFGNALVVG